MKTSVSLAFGLGLALAVPLMAGCAGEEAEGEGAAYPEPIGYDAPGAPLPPGQVAASSSTQPVQGIPAAGPSPLPAPDPGVDGAQDDANDVAVGGSDGSEYADTDPSALTDFRSTLDPYGTWVDDPTYGTVWQPSPSVVGSDFTPYVTAGSWTYDDSGDYVWASDYDWGWAPFHYGRWAYIGTGWGWIPGRTYAGAWVSWRDGGGYLGWAPLPPTWYWRSGYAFGLGVVPYAPYSFCGYHNVFQPHFGGGLVTGGAVVGVAAGTHPYVPAHPTVGGAGGAGNGAGGGRVAAHPTVGGPTPSSLGLQPKEVAHASGQSSAGIAHAQAFAHPTTAQTLGAHAPTVNTARASNTYASPGQASNYAAASRMPAYGRANTVVASGPRYNGVSPAPYHSPSYSVPRGSYGGSSYNGAHAYGSAPSYGSPHASSPYYSGGTHYGAPSYGGGAYRGVGAAHPSTSSSSSSSQSEPGYAAPHHSSSGGGYRGGGGFHGGGGGGHAGGGHR